MSVAKDKEKASAGRRPWATPALNPMGTVADVLRGGGGKLTVTAADTGDTPRFPKGQM